MHFISQLPTQQKAQEILLWKMSLEGVETLTDTWEVCNVMRKQGNQAAERTFKREYLFYYNTIYSP